MRVASSACLMCTLIGIGHRQCHRAFLIPCSEAHRPALLRLALCRAHMLVESVLSTFNEYALAPGCASQGTASAGGPRPPPTSSSPAAWRAESAPSRAPSTPTASRCHATLPQSRLPLELPLSPTVSHRHVVLLTDRWTMLLCCMLHGMPAVEALRLPQQLVVCHGILHGSRTGVLLLYTSGT